MAKRKELINAIQRFLGKKFDDDDYIVEVAEMAMSELEGQEKEEISDSEMTAILFGFMAVAMEDISKSDVSESKKQCQIDVLFHQVMGGWFISALGCAGYTYRTVGEVVDAQEAERKARGESVYIDPRDLP